VSEGLAYRDALKILGSSESRLVGLLDTVTDSGGMEDACAALEADAAAARIEVRRMWWAQDAGFAMAALPLGMGLPRRRW
jgi:hypothetical protein